MRGGFLGEPTGRGGRKCVFLVGGWVLGGFRAKVGLRLLVSHRYLVSCEREGGLQTYEPECQVDVEGKPPEGFGDVGCTASAENTYG